MISKERNTNKKLPTTSVAVAQAGAVSQTVSYTNRKKVPKKLNFFFGTFLF